MSLLFYFGLVGLILIFCILSNYVDYDFYARLIVGKSFLQTDSLFDYDFYSYGTTHKFIDHEWGSGVIFQLILDNFGEIGLFVFKSLCLFLTYFLIAKIIKLDNKDARLYILPFFFVIQSVAANVFTTIRCQTFSFLFFVLYLYILKFAKIKNNYKILWTIPLLNIIWTNLHGGFVMGIILLALFCLGEFLNKQKIKIIIISYFRS